MKDSVDVLKTGGVLRLRNYITEEFLALIQNSYTYLSKTCTIIYDVDGNPASKLIASPYCSFLRMASEKKELCENCCWEISLEAIKRREIYESECLGGCIVFSCPIIFDDTVIGVNSTAVSNPPKSRFKIFDIASNFKVDPAILLDVSKKSATTQKYILDNIREQMVLSTDMISKFFKYAYEVKQREAALIARYQELKKKNQELKQKIKHFT